MTNHRFTSRRQDGISPTPDSSCAVCGLRYRHHPQPAQDRPSDEHIAGLYRRLASGYREDAEIVAHEGLALLVAERGLCDDDGYRGAILCDHDPDGDARTSRGIAAVKAALAGKDA